MKRQLSKRLLAFITMMLCISYLHAQCPGTKVQLYKATRSGGCISKCVPQSQVQRYLGQGWSPFCTVGFRVKNNSNKEGIKPNGPFPDETGISQKRKVIAVSRK